MPNPAQTSPIFDLESFVASRSAWLVQTSLDKKSHSACWLAIQLADYLNDETADCYPLLITMARSSDVSIDKAQRASNLLVKQGHLATTVEMRTFRYKGGWKTALRTVYRPVPKEPTDPRAPPSFRPAKPQLATVGGRPAGAAITADLRSKTAAELRHIEHVREREHVAEGEPLEAPPALEASINTESPIAAEIQEGVLLIQASPAELEPPASQRLSDDEGSKGSEPLSERPSGQEGQEVQEQLLVILKQTRPRIARMLLNVARADWRVAGGEELGDAVGRQMMDAARHVRGLELARAET